MITFDEAVNKAIEYLEKTEVPVVITLQGRFSEGWFFYFQSRAYLETGYFSAQLIGNSPFIIDKDAGEIHELGTAYPIEKYLQDYEEEKNGIKD
ncbi:YrhB family protein [Enterobacter quasiroggenkampii]|uniref:YrhB family protein n=1 Tax=Enterobacter quasiroggenkampii TaxID=2497436 RepID=UPI0021CE0012|nr:YrhB family protein [Enterobacter quasiroggenkampii]MCU6348444.1 YrhB family protein [Enterobacter quasiroggenkampii]